jgi:WD-40 repeat-containing protein
VTASPTVADGTVYIGSGDGVVYALPAAVEGSSEGSRALLGTFGHHDDWRYADQSIDLDPADSTDGDGTSDDDDGDGTSDDDDGDGGDSNGRTFDPWMGPAALAGLGAAGYAVTRLVGNEVDTGDEADAGD